MRSIGAERCEALGDRLVVNPKCSSDRAVAQAEVPEVCCTGGDSLMKRRFRRLGDYGANDDFRRGSNSLRPRPLFVTYPSRL